MIKKVPNLTIKIAIALAMCLLFIGNSVRAQYTDNAFKLKSTTAQAVTINKVFSSLKEEVKLVHSNVNGISVSGTVQLKSNRGFVRIVLVDANYNEYLIYETNILFGKTVSFNNVCVETALLNKITTSKLVIEVSEASLNLSTVTVSKETTKGTISNFTQQSNELKMAQLGAMVYELNSKIKANGLKWAAGETPLAKMTYTEKKVIFGGKVPNLYGFEYYKGGIFEIPSKSALKAAAASSSYISTYSWRNRHSQDWTSSVKNQAGCGSCWAFAVTGSTELMTNLYFNRHLDLDLSEQQILSCSGAGTCQGGWPGTSLDYIKNTGIFNESCFPYTATDQPCTNACINPTERIKIGGKNDWAYSIEDSLKAMILRGSVSGGIYSWSHAMNLVGWRTIKAGETLYLSGSQTIIADNDPLIGRVAWEFKNSWGAYWGDAGYSYIVVDISDIGWTHELIGAVTSINYDTNDIICTDNDGDGYYSWGIGPKPSHCPPCPAFADGDDSNANLGPMNRFGYCKKLGQNQAPIANAGVDMIKYTPLESTFSLDGNLSTDPDYDELSYDWKQTSGPACTITNHGNMVATVSNFGIGIYEFELTVNDGLITSSDRITVTVEKEPNIALNKPVIASSNETTDLIGSKANDGNSNTRWSSAMIDPQTLQIDLLNYYNLNRVVLKWHENYAKSYQIQVSNDAINWRSVYYEYNGNGGYDSIPLYYANGKYIRIYGTERATNTTYSLYEFEVYGKITENHAPIVNAGADRIETLPLEYFNLYSYSSYDPDNDAIVGTWKQISGPVTLKIEFDTWGNTIIKSDNFVQGYYKFELTVSDGLISSKDTLGVTLQQLDNIALNKNSWASSIENSNYTANNVNDGKLNTRWSSNFSDPQYITIDLGQSYRLQKVALNWETASAKKYEIQISNDNIHWERTIYWVYDGNGAKDIMNVYGKARYIRVYGTERNTPAGYSLWEFEVYGIAEPNNPPTTYAGSDFYIINTGTPFNLNQWGSSDPDGDMLYYSWKKVSGPSCNLNVDQYGTTKVVNYSTGVYEFELTASDGIATSSDRMILTIRDAVASVSIVPTTITVEKGNTYQLAASVLPTSANQSVIWTTSNDLIATVSETGIITAVGTGSANITATSVDDYSKKDVCVATVVITYYKMKNRWKTTTYLKDDGAGKVTYGTSPVATDFAYQWSKETVSGYTLLKNRSTGFYMHNENLYDYVQTGTIQPAWYSAMWTLENTGDGWLRIRNRYKTTDLVHIENLKGYAQRLDANNTWWSAMWQLETVTAASKSVSIFENGISENASVTLFPNPVTKKVLNVALTGFDDNEKVTLTFTDFSGRTIAQKIIYESGAINLDIPGGIYIVNVNSKGFNKAIKLIVE